MTTITALFDRREKAEDVIQELSDMGVPGDEISLVRRARDGEVEVERSAAEDVEEGVTIGTGVGATVGGIAGLLAGLGVLTLPGLGFLVAAGPLYGLLSGGVVGALTGGLMGALIDLGIPEQEAELYAEGVRRGGTLVVVDTDEARAPSVIQLLERYQPIDIERRAEMWRERGWEGYDREAEPLSWDKIEEEREAYRVWAHHSEDFEMGNWDEKDWRESQHALRRHFQMTYNQEGDRRYDAYRPAYRYGYELAADEQYRGWAWDRLAPDARRGWQARHGDVPWDSIAEAVRVGWERFAAPLDAPRVLPDAPEP